MAGDPDGLSSCALLLTGSLRCATCRLAPRRSCGCVAREIFGVWLAVDSPADCLGDVHVDAVGCATEMLVAHLLPELPAATA